MITKASLVEADLIIYQMSRIFGLSYNSRWYWFPNLYCYLHGKQDVWVKLESKAYCKKIMPLFGVSNFEELKNKIDSCTYDAGTGYEGSHNAVPVIKSSIKIERIAALN